MASGDKIKWNEANFKWNDNPHIWNLVVELSTLVETGADVIQAIKEFEPEKKKRFIRLVCKVKGIEHYSGQKTIKTDDINITVKDVELVIKEVLGKSITVENVHV